jgi:HEAT repeat protein
MRRVLRLGIVALLLLGIPSCSSKPPYQGKSAAELEQMLADPDPKVQTQGAFGLSQLGPEARSAVPALVEALKRDLSVRENAALALGNIGPDAREAVAALIEALGDLEWNMRRLAALALGKIGADAAPAVPSLLKLGRDPDKRVQQAAREAVAKIQPQGRP